MGHKGRKAVDRAKEVKEAAGTERGSIAEDKLTDRYYCNFAHASSPVVMYYLKGEQGEPKWCSGYYVLLT